MQVEHLTRLMGESFATAVRDRIPEPSVIHATCLGQRFALSAVAQSNSLGPLFLAASAEAWSAAGLGGSNPFPYSLVEDDEHPLGLRIVRGPKAVEGEDAEPAHLVAEPLAVLVAITTARTLGEGLPMSQVSHMDWALDVSELVLAARGVEPVSNIDFVEAPVMP